ASQRIPGTDRFSQRLLREEQGPLSAVGVRSRDRGQRGQSRALTSRHGPPPPRRRRGRTPLPGPGRRDPPPPPHSPPPPAGRSRSSAAPIPTPNPPPNPRPVPPPAPRRPGSTRLRSRSSARGPHAPAITDRATRTARAPHNRQPALYGPRWARRSDASHLLR